jgi:type IV pilus assembly protein PilO
MNFDLIKNIDLNNPSTWPAPVKILGIVLASSVILAAGYMLFIQDQYALYQRKQAEEKGLKETFFSKKAMAINLLAYKQQIEEMQQTFGVLLRQLPNTTEVPNLLVDITQAGLGRGLDFVLFKPEKERPVEFYAELPISIKVTGGYHELGGFISDVAALPRIVTFGDINISADAKTGKLSVSALAKTYRYLESGEIDAIQAEKKKTVTKGKPGGQK